MKSASVATLPLRPELKSREVIRLALAYSLATSGLVLSPFLVAAVMLRFQLDESIATQIAGVEILGVALSCAFVPRWIVRGTHRFTLIAVLGTLGGQLASALVTTAAAISIARGFTGICEGILFVIVAAGISQRIAADQLWGKINLMAGAINGSILVVISYLPESWLGRCLFVLLLGVAVIVAPAILGVGQFTQQSTQSRSCARVPIGLVLTIWAVTGLVYGIQASQWAVSGIVGSHAGLSPSMIGILLSVSSLLGFCGAIIPSLRASHGHRLAIIWLAQLGLIGSIIWFFRVTDSWSYFFSQLALNASFFVIIPFMTGLLSEVDPDGSLVAWGVVVTFIGAGVGTAVAGSLFAQLGGMPFSYWLGVGIALAMPLVWLSLRGGGQHRAHVATQQAIG
ncbi:MFS transporter [Pseudomonas sp. N-137]|uniref:MFS transporter n=1 Tax=Pseudomonas sp. N-137 TaxID=3108452 RepID=UPI002ADEF890|nr:MFS transporter [Pseudomonas sp. N-137]MEA1030544.1 MFS transporter [Pseudomonas sp. N-137]